MRFFKGLIIGWIIGLIWKCICWLWRRIWWFLTGGCRQLVEKLINKVMQFAYILEMLAGAAVMLVPAAYSFFTFWLPKTPAMFITWIGAVIGACLFMDGLRRYRRSHPKIVDKWRRIKRLEKRNKQLERQVKEFYSTTRDIQLNVDTIQSQLTLTLLRLGTHLKDFKRKELESVTISPTRFKQGTTTTTEHLGYIDMEVELAFGIDLEKVKIHDKGTYLEVSGVTCAYHGAPKQRRIKANKYYELRERKEYTGGTCEHKILNVSKDKMLTNAYDAHLDDLADRLEKNVDLIRLEGAAQYVVRLGQEFIKNFLLPTGRDIEFVDKCDTQGFSIAEYAKKHNKEIHETKQITDER